MEYKIINKKIDRYCTVLDIARYLNPRLLILFNFHQLLQETKKGHGRIEFIPYFYFFFRTIFLIRSQIFNFLKLKI
jgi:hypothetical protein